MIDGFVLNNRSLNNRIVLKRPYAVVSGYLIVRKIEPRLRTLSFRKDNIVISLKIVGNIVSLSWIDDRIDVINCKIEVWRCLEQKINVLLRGTRTILTRKVAAR